MITLIMAIVLGVVLCLTDRRSLAELIEDILKK